MSVAMADQPGRASFTFTGSGFGLLGWSIVVALAQIVILPLAWASAAYYRWFFGKLQVSDGARASFDGNAEEVWGWFALVGVLWWVQQAPRLADDPGAAMGITLLVTLLVLPISAGVWLSILRWVIANANVGSGSHLRFTGTYAGYLGWSLLLLVSLVTIIGWAWATVGMLQWLCRNIEGGERRFQFEISGWDVLWRTIALAVTAMFLIPIPWMLAWFVRWYVSCVRMETVPAAAPSA